MAMLVRRYMYSSSFKRLGVIEPPGTLFAFTKRPFSNTTGTGGNENGGTHMDRAASLYRTISAETAKENMHVQVPGSLAHLQVDKHIKLKHHRRGVFQENDEDDINVLVQNFTAPALAEALRDREITLQRAATLFFSGETEELKELLVPFLDESVERRRLRHHHLDLSKGFTRKEIVILQRYLHRMPRHVFHNAERRASVIIPLCNVNGVASVLFERRSMKVRTHKQQVCFPGGMLDEGVDSTIIQTSLREMEEELGIPREKIEVLGILRCNWNEVASMTGIAVTPVIGFIGELNDLVLTPNSDEVEQYFTIPLEDLLDEQKWLTRNFSTPVFTGGPHTIWGLTAYLLEKFLKEVVMKCTSNNI